MNDIKQVNKRFDDFPVNIQNFKENLQVPLTRREWSELLNNLR